MTLRQNKVAIRLGNFVYYGDDYGVVIKRDETIVGDMWTFLSLSSGDIVMLREHQLTPYTRRKMEDVSTFIGLFKEASIGVTRKARQRLYDQYEGLDGFDVFHR